MESTLAHQALLKYGVSVPNHRGKWWVHSQLRRLFNIHPEGDQIVERRGLRWLLNPADYVQADLYWYGSKDMWEIHHLIRHLPENGTFLDVGSNFGYYSLVLADSLGRQCTVHSFEPNPGTFARLQRNVSLNSMKSIVHPHCVALSSDDGAATLADDVRNSGASRITDSGEGIRIETTTLDKFVSTVGLNRVDCIKLDVEGFEERVLQGGASTLREYRPVLAIEINPPALAAQGSSPRQVVDHLRECRYDIQEIHRNKLVPLKRLPDGEDYINVLCLPS